MCLTVPLRKLPNLCRLESDHLRRDALGARAQLTEGVGEVADPVARGKPRNVRTPQVQARTERVDHAIGIVAEARQRASGATELCHRDRLAHGREAHADPRKLVGPARRLEAKGHRDRLLSVRPGCHGRRRIPLRELLTRALSRRNPCDQPRQRAANLQDHAGVDDVLCRGAPVDVAAVFAAPFGQSTNDGHERML